MKKKNTFPGQFAVFWRFWVREKACKGRCFDAEGGLTRRGADGKAKATVWLQFLFFRDFDAHSTGRKISRDRTTFLEGSSML